MSKELKKEKEIILTGIKPTGDLTLGNYLGAIKNIKRLQNEFPNAEFYIFIADLHATTLPIDPNELSNNIRKIAAFLIASSFDLKRTNIFVQSDVLEHANMGYLMESTVYIGELERMIQYKEKSKQVAKNEGIRSSLLTYPALMAADILLYNADYVPVGEDQMQHLELTALLANRFNKLYGNTFKIPKGVSNNALRIMSLQDPKKKMSKSDVSKKSYILLIDNEKDITKKIKSAVTDSENKIYYDEEKKPGLANLINIYSAIKDISRDEIVKKYKNKSYRDFKEDLAAIVVDEISPIKTKYDKIIDSKELDDILNKGFKNAQKRASKILKLAKEKIGLIK